jgi:hypothetical protein
MRGRSSEGLTRNAGEAEAHNASNSKPSEIEMSCRVEMIEVNSRV